MNIMTKKVYVSLAAVKDLIKQVKSGPIMVATETGYKLIENPADSLIKRIEAIQDTIVSVDIQGRYMCRSRGIICEMASDYGDCRLTVCIKRGADDGRT